MRQNEQLIQTRTFHTEKGRIFVKESNLNLCLTFFLGQQCRKKRRRRKTLDATKLDSRERTNRKDVGVGKLLFNCCLSVYIVLNET